ncbi:ankyrin repeat-containing domain protein [Lentinula edodes]|uniref:ankyrin repeat-containing domain protein n=1 Tax=Lentinula edodes TaxID=5353 RepID=UPI001E8E3849|nr:ankyrin repeat-containing domain protein [Lentinula edodes]KAH7880189.1 ankyrin repeat-containing domain protein [Lentinula edodes]
MRARVLRKIVSLSTTFSIMSKRTNTNSNESPIQMFAQATQLAFHNSSFNAAGRDINYYTIFNEDEKMIHKWLGAPDSSINMCTALDRKTSGTGNWIFHDPQYIHWMKQGGMLWIQGKAGSGKTILLSTLIESLQTDPQKLVCYHYFDTRDTTGVKSSYQGLLSSILQQLGSSNSRIHPALKVLHQSSKTGLIFRWIDCQLNILKECKTSKAARRAMQNLPLDLQGTYEQAVQKCKNGPNSTEAYHILLWLLYAFEPLDQKQITAILSIDLEQQVVESSDEIAFKIENIVDSTLVAINSDGVVQLAHASVKEFLLLKQILKASSFQYHHWTDKYKLQTFPYTTKKGMNPFWWAACLGLLPAVNDITLLDKNFLNQPTGDLGTPLSAAAYFERENSVHFLLHIGADVNAQGGEFGNALQAAACCGNINIVKCLFESGANVNAQGGLFGNALQAASWNDHRDVVQYLLKNGADANVQGGQYGSALVAAAYEGNEIIVKWLVAHGADVNIQVEFFLGNALQTAAYEGYETIVQYLLLNGADINAEGGEYGSALKAAASKGHENIFIYLLDNGANLNAQSSEYGHVLQSAIRRGNERIVKRFLDDGADVNTQGGYHGNALQTAVFWGHETMVKHFLENGAEVNVSDGPYGNILRSVQYAYNGRNEKMIQILVEFGAKNT